MVLRKSAPAARLVPAYRKPTKPQKSAKPPEAEPTFGSEVLTSVVAGDVPGDTAVGSEALPKPKKPAKSKSKLPKIPPVKADAKQWHAKGRPTLSELSAGTTPFVPESGSRALTELATQELRERFKSLQDRLTAQGQKSVLVVLQAMDTGGKDGTVKSIYSGANPGGLVVHSYSAPSTEELSHDFLWRIHKNTPAKGQIAIFNRSHYEDVLAVRVRNLAPRTIWEPRYAAINSFEELLTRSGTKVIKIMLHISQSEQRDRLQARLDRPEKRWKFRSVDLDDRVLWGAYKRAYQDTIARTHTEVAPWHIVPADKKWYRDYAVMNIVVAELEAMNLSYPLRPELDGLKVN